MPAFLLAVADAACPQRIAGVPEGLLKKLQPGKITGFLCLGDVAPSIVYALKRIATDFKRVAGNLDEERNLPQTLVFEQEGVTIGMAHGHLVMPQGDSNALEALRRRMAVDVLLTGSTGKAQTITTARGVLVNPGSITGAKASPLASGFASYTLLVLDNGKVSVYNYWLNEVNEVKFTHVDWIKPRSGTATSAVHPPVRLPGATTTQPATDSDAQGRSAEGAGAPAGLEGQAGGAEAQAAGQLQTEAAERTESSTAAGALEEDGAAVDTGVDGGPAQPAPADPGPPAHLDDEEDERARSRSGTTVNDAGDGGAKGGGLAGSDGLSAVAQSES